MSKLKSLSIVAAALAIAIVGVSVASAQTSSIAAQIAQLQAQIAALQSQLGSSASTAVTAYTFTTNLKIGAKGDGVTALQNFLISKGYLSGSATGYFGRLTKAALAKYQAAKGISATGYFGPKTRVALNADLALAVAVTPTPTPTTTTTTTATTTAVVTPSGDQLTAALDSSSPAVGNYPVNNVQPFTGSVYSQQVPFTAVKFTAGTKDVTVTAMNVYRGGIASDNDISNVYLMSGSVVLATNITLSNGKAIFSNSNGLFTVKAGTSRIITIAADQGTSGSKTISFSVNAITDITASSPVAGTFPVSGNILTGVAVSSPSLASLTVSTSTTASTINAGTTGFIAGQFNLQAGNSAVQVRSIKLTETGTINAAADVSNIQLMNGATQVGSTVANLNADGTVVFDLSSNPLQIPSGQTVNLTVVVNVNSGVSRNFQFTIQHNYDIVAKDMTYNVYAILGGTGSVNPPYSATQVSVNSGSLVISKASTSPANYIAPGTTGAMLAQFNFQALGEPIRVTALNFSIGGYTSAVENTVWNNLLIVDDQGTQIGATKTSGTATDTSATSTLTNLNYIIPANTTRILTVKADIVSSFNNNVNGNIVSGTAQGYTSLLSISIGSFTGNTLSASNAPFVASLNNTVGAITTVSGATGVKIGSFTLTAGPAEGVNMTSMALQTASTSAYQNLRVYLGPTDTTQFGTTQTSLSSGGTNTLTGTVAIPAGGAQVLDVFADTISGVTSGAGALVTLTSAQGNGAVTNVSRAATFSSGSSQAGQAVTINSAGSLTDQLSATTIVSQQASMGMTGVKLGSFQFNANNNEPIQITAITVSSTQSRAQDIVNLRLMQGSTQVGSTVVSLTGNTTSSTTFVLPANALIVPQNSYTTVDVLADINSFINGAVSTDTVALGITTVQYQGNLSKATNSTSTAINEGATFTVYRTSLTVAQGPSFTVSGVNGVGAILAEFNYTAGSNNNVLLTSTTISIASTSLATGTTVSVLGIYDSANAGQVLATSTLTGNGGNMTFNFASSTTAPLLASYGGLLISGGTTKTLIIKTVSMTGTIASTNNTGTFQVNLQGAIWNDGTVGNISLNPIIAIPVPGQYLTGLAD